MSKKERVEPRRETKTNKPTLNDMCFNECVCRRQRTFIATRSEAGGIATLVEQNELSPIKVREMWLWRRDSTQHSTLYMHLDRSIDQHMLNVDRSTQDRTKWWCKHWIKSVLWRLFLYCYYFECAKANAKLNKLIQLLNDQPPSATPCRRRLAWK